MSGVRLSGAGGLALAADAWGDDAAPPLVLLHGGGQTRGAWGEAGARLAALGWRVLAVDLRGHGESAWSDDGVYSVDRYADDVRALARGLGAPPVLVGASLGGMSSLLAAGEEPRAGVAGLVLVDVAHRPHAAGVRRIVEFMSARPEGFESVDEAAGAVAAYLPHRTQPEVAAGLERNLRRQGDRWVWHWDPRLLTMNPATLSPDRFVAAARAVDAPTPARPGRQQRRDHRGDRRRIRRARTRKRARRGRWRRPHGRRRPQRPVPGGDGAVPRPAQPAIVAHAAGVSA